MSERYGETMILADDAGRTDFSDVEADEVADHLDEIRRKSRHLREEHFKPVWLTEYDHDWLYEAARQLRDHPHQEPEDD